MTENNMARIHLTYTHVTKCTNTNKYKVYYAITAKVGSTIGPATVSDPDVHGEAKIGITLNATSNSGVIILSGSALVSNIASIINIELNGQASKRPYFGCKINMGLYAAGDLDECEAGDLISDRPYIASAATDDTETYFDRNVLIKEEMYQHTVASTSPSGKSVSVSISTSDKPSGNWRLFPIDTVSGAVTNDTFFAEINGNPTKKKKTKIPVTGHVITPRT